MPQSTTPLFDNLVEAIKERFWAYRGPETFPDETDEGKLAAFDLYHAVDDVVAQMDPQRRIEIILEAELTGNPWWSFEDILKKFPMPRKVYVQLFKGEPVTWPGREELEQINAEFLRDGTDMADEFTEALGDVVGSDPKVKAESDRRWAAAGRGDEL